MLPKPRPMHNSALSVPGASKRVFEGTSETAAFPILPTQKRPRTHSGNLSEPPPFVPNQIPALASINSRAFASSPTVARSQFVPSQTSTPTPANSHIFAPYEPSLPVIDPHMTPHRPYQIPSQSRHQPRHSLYAPAQFNSSSYQRSLFTPAQENHGVQSQILRPHQASSSIAPMPLAYTHHGSATYGATPSSSSMAAPESSQYDGSPATRIYLQSAGPSFTHHHSATSDPNCFVTPSSRQSIHVSQYPDPHGPPSSEHSTAVYAGSQPLSYNYYTSESFGGRYIG
ncbi:hypothetical protein BJ138DRAFT_1119795 [Hygrophoropsis aurantiaca]|uniref:Uncharacterized protein n=1 Tax=Hygrophoropsis aurantiaca TaxID=72124 RepID=A0ACB7ZTI5_9AGAM|nr:hypothetical protein BJ138DRAFT_1119795 [Hygrophoropsis aurantiaca]